MIINFGPRTFYFTLCGGDAEIFEEIPEAQDDEEHNLAMKQKKLDLSGDLLEPGRVYRLDNSLAVSIDRFKIKRKRLVASTSSSTGGKLPRNRKKTKQSKVQWFVKKLIFARKPEDEDDPSIPQRN